MQKEFIKNAIHDFTNEEITLHSAVYDLETLVGTSVGSGGGGNDEEKGSRADAASDRFDTPVPTRQVLSLRGGSDGKNVGVKPFPSSVTSELLSKGEEQVGDEDSGKLRAATLHTIATLFYKLITTFKHS